MHDLGLDNAVTAHKAYLLALICCGKLVSENMFKVLNEFKQSASQYEKECIYCKYSTYAIKES